MNDSLILARLERLEAQNARWRRGAALLALLLGACLAALSTQLLSPAYAAPAAQDIKASRIQIVDKAGKTRIVAHVPSRGLIGYHGEFLTDTRGTGVLNRVFHGWTEYKGAIPGRRAGVLISMENGEAVAYALWNLEERGKLFVEPQDKVYQGMIIGEHARENDLEVNPLKGKKLTNVRASGSDDAVRLTPVTQLTLEQAIAYINDDELVEVTPSVVRLRKRYLDPHERKRMAKAAQ